MPYSLPSWSPRVQLSPSDTVCNVKVMVMIHVRKVTLSIWANSTLERFQNMSPKVLLRRGKCTRLPPQRPRVQPTAAGVPSNTIGSVRRWEACSCQCTNDSYWLERYLEPLCTKQAKCPVMYFLLNWVIAKSKLSGGPFQSGKDTIRSESPASFSPPLFQPVFCFSIVK